jgi:hypothetical protein
VLEIEPSGGEIDHLTLSRTEPPFTVAVNCCGGEEGVKLVLAGATDRFTAGLKVMAGAI